MNLCCLSLPNLCPNSLDPSTQTFKILDFADELPLLAFNFLKLSFTSQKINQVFHLSI
jgi:hypothetical protein